PFRAGCEVGAAHDLRLAVSPRDEDEQVDRALRSMPIERTSTSRWAPRHDRRGAHSVQQLTALRVERRAWTMRAACAVFQMEHPPARGPNQRESPHPRADSLVRGNRTGEVRPAVARATWFCSPSENPALNEKRTRM